MESIKSKNEAKLATYCINDFGIFMQVEKGVLAVYSEEETYQFGEFIHADDFIRDEFNEFKFPMVDFTKAEDYYYQREMTEEIYLASPQSWNAILNDSIEMKHLILNQSLDA